MKGSLCHEFETGLPAAEVWEMYRGLRISQVVPQLLPVSSERSSLLKEMAVSGQFASHLFSWLEPEHMHFSYAFFGFVLYASASVISILVVRVARDCSIRISKEKFIKIDHENYVKEVIVVGGLLDHGFQKYLIRIEIIGQTKKTSTIRSSIEYEVDDEKTDNASFASTGALANLAEAITEYVKAQKSAEQAREETA
ncbi:hypothetical protein ZWY2020_012969 [Hordeum vulgare]|nr:hypothetical protein ZWY2020_012969 [Hordeum vulgare]